jgi:hypothetical protein
MEVHVRTESLAQSSSGMITGEIFLGDNATFFPEERWNDFPVVILGWWLEVLATVSAGVAVECRFMDGPFLFRVSPLPGQMCCIEFLGSQSASPPAQAQLPQLQSSVRSAALAVLAACNSNGWRTQDTQHLHKLCKPRLVGA